MEVPDPEAPPVEAPPAAVIVPTTIPEAPLELAQTVGRLEEIVSRLEGSLPSIQSTAEEALQAARTALDRVDAPPVEAPPVEEIVTEPPPVAVEVVPASPRSWWKELII